LSYKTARDSWHGAAINSHSFFSKFISLNAVEGEILAQRGLFQLMEVDEPTGRLSTDENRGLMQELVTHCYNTRFNSSLNLYALALQQTNTMVYPLPGSLFSSLIELSVDRQETTKKCTA
jgi:hypothetical protein